VDWRTRQVAKLELWTVPSAREILRGWWAVENWCCRARSLWIKEIEAPESIIAKVWRKELLAKRVMGIVIGVEVLLRAVFKDTGVG
jgi:hypothetical protein